MIYMIWDSMNVFCLFFFWFYGLAMYLVFHFDSSFTPIEFSARTDTLSQKHSATKERQQKPSEK